MESEADDESRDSQVIEAKAVYFEENYEVDSGNSLQSLNNSGATKGRYYKQTYRTAWEQMPDFKGMFIVNKYENEAPFIKKILQSWMWRTEERLYTSTIIF